MITVSGLSFNYSKGTSLVFPNFVLKPGEHVLLFGESGSGKTTLLHIIGGLLRNYTGSVQIDQKELSAMSEAGLDNFRGQKMGFIFQRNHLISALTVEKNLMISPYLAGMPIDKGRINAVLTMLDLYGRKNSSVTTLSQGQAQRVAIARAILNKPAILFADEPTSALDDKNCARVVQLLFEAAAENNSTLIIATHDQRLKDKISKSIILS